MTSRDFRDPRDGGLVLWGHRDADWATAFSSCSLLRCSAAGGRRSSSRGIRLNELNECLLVLHDLLGQLRVGLGDLQQNGLQCRRVPLHRLSDLGEHRRGSQLIDQTASPAGCHLREGTWNGASRCLSGRGRVRLGHWGVLLFRFRLTQFLGNTGHQILHSPVWIVESRAHCSNALLPRESHVRQLGKHSLVLLPSDQGGRCRHVCIASPGSFWGGCRSGGRGCGGGCSGCCSRCSWLLGCHHHQEIPFLHAVVPQGLGVLKHLAGADQPLAVCREISPRLCDLLLHIADYRCWLNLQLPLLVLDSLDLDLHDDGIRATRFKAGARSST
mmetsp:Transcript_8214/g.19669  ORF Transcript_8214/g.19669 Transcript_8214/m.19669 type:complete len:329 (-) Transcript_8214:2-988(-)